MNRFALPMALLLLLLPTPALLAEDGMYGGDPSRNMADDATGLPSHFDIETGENVKWSQPLGSQAYGGPVVSGSRIFVGTNNEGKRNPKLTGDRGNVMAFDVESGAFLWQSAHAKLPAGRIHDWPLQGVCSAPYVQGDRLWYVSNQAEIICADVEGFLDGENDGPITDEENNSTIDEDVVWSLDMIDELGVFPHNLAVGSPLVIGDLLFLVTGNGVDEGHVNIPTPRAPDFLALNKNTGEIVWESSLPGEGLLHGSWSNPTYGVVAGQPQIVFPGGDGWLYSFVPETGELIWKFDCNPKDSVWQLGGAGTRNNIIATPVFWEGAVYIAVGQDPEHGEGEGHLWAIDASKKGDITETGLLWHFGDENYNRTMSTVAIADGILYTADLSGFAYALDVKTGEKLWTYDTYAAIWGSPFVADGKVYLGDEDGDVAVMKAGRKFELLSETNMGTAVYTTPIAKDGVLFIASRSRLFALADGIPAPKAEPKGAEKAGGEGR